jgi:hypothetical protein
MVRRLLRRKGDRGDHCLYSEDKVWYMQTVYNSLQCSHLGARKERAVRTKETSRIDNQVCKSRNPDLFGMI